ncbi:alpha/beta hydrolase [Halostella salina]|uniref:alpha/beta hydrolase n=1 Tax=Halostella salina TaxID=1547897 RepID=UPI000EF76F6A|nr:alpha/beta hydrolase [Halostella salina]
MRTELDGAIAAVVERIEREGIPEWHALSVDAARRIEDEVFGGADPPPVDLVRDLAVDGPGGDLPLRVYRPDAETPAPVVVFYHGGGWTLGTLDSSDDICRQFARRTGAVVVSVDYRLAPEHPFPAAVDDAYAALRWVAEHAGAVGGDPERLAVAGTSAGGNLAAATALRARDEGGPDLAAQALCYPMVDDAALDGGVDGGDATGDDSGGSYAENADGPLLTRRDVAWFWDQYLRSSVDRANPYAVPAETDDFGDLPPATVVTCGHDPLRDEGADYAEALDDAGVDVDHLHYPSVPHGVLSLAEDAAVADEAFGDVAASLRARL